MERYMLHLKNKGYSPKNSRELVYKARDLCADMDASIRVARVASDFVELDVSVEQDKMESLVEKLSPIGTLDNARHVFEEEIAKEQGIRDGIFYFNNERFWESHEAFEGVWKKCVGREKELVQGIILLAVAFAHAQKNEESIGIGMLTRALEKLGNSPSMYTTIDVDRIRQKIKEMQAENKLTIFEI
ncbi:DUF309 domain-containing protein [Nitrosopumilus sp. K4]|uniref:DUF309 domain-containing protein n=1 Tax=Nitrosopumilus sp. K4 TaxID=2795383 RepID=UPI002012EAA8|nr:DUF309 domain-containing protein [Nitrosopumilus sp. K4]